MKFAAARFENLNRLAHNCERSLDVPGCVMHPCCKDQAASVCRNLRACSASKCGETLCDISRLNQSAGAVIEPVNEPCHQVALMANPFV